MKIRCRQVVKDESINHYRLIDIADISNLRVSEHCCIAIDGSTATTGITVVRYSDNFPLFIIRISREESEAPVKYKVMLKRVLKDLLENNPMIVESVYEEPTLRFASAVKNLFMLRTSVEELVYENEPQFDYLKYPEINNKRWKRLWIAPDKLKGTSDEEKVQIANKFKMMFPYFTDVVQDEMDSTGLGMIYVYCRNAGYDIKDLESKKKAHKFDFKVEFIGADDDECAFMDLIEMENSPKFLFDAGVTLVDFTSRGELDKAIYEAMGSDDKIVIIKYKSSSHGNINLKYNLGRLAAEYDYIYAVAWRKNRKR